MPQIAKKKLKEIAKVAKVAKVAKIAKIAELARNCPKLPETARNCMKLFKLQALKIAPNCVKLAQIAPNYPRENNGLHDITRSCLSLVRVRHCSSTLSSDRIFIKINIHTHFHIIFHLLFSAERGIIFTRIRARAVVYSNTHTYFHKLLDSLVS